LISKQPSDQNTETAMQIALFGTSADPPTRAHQQAMAWLSQKFELVAVWAADNPDKVHGATLEQRTLMLELLVKEIPDAENIKVYRELSHRQTIRTIGVAQSIWPTAEFHLAIGADLVEQIERWHNGTELLRQVNLIIIPRPGWELRPVALDRLRELGCKFQLVMELNTLAVSSTAMRQTNDLEDLHLGLTTAVTNYIDQHHLYLR
jgi:nicotinate-nucleotide adenylyltransferase